MVPYLFSVALVVAGLLLLGALVWTTMRAARRFTSTTAKVNDRIGDGSGMLRARTAALGVAIRQRRRVRIKSGLTRVRSGEQQRQEDGRG